MLIALLDFKDGPLRLHCISPNNLSFSHIGGRFEVVDAFLFRLGHVFLVCSADVNAVNKKLVCSGFEIQTRNRSRNCPTEDGVGYVLPNFL